MNVLWTHNYPGHVDPPRGTSPPPQQWTGFHADRQGKTMVCFGVLQTDWIEVKTGRLIRHIHDGRTMNACLSDDGTWLCLMGNQGATLYREGLVVHPPFSGPIAYSKGAFRPDGGALTLCEDNLARSFPLQLDIDSSAGHMQQLAEARTGRYLKDGLMYRYDDAYLETLRHSLEHRGEPGKQE